MGGDQEHIILQMCACNNLALNFRKHKFAEIQKEITKSTITGRNFNTTLSVDKLTSSTINEDIDNITP